MPMTTSSSFVAACIDHADSAREPARQSRRRGGAWCEEAAAAGADFVQTPEMTSIRRAQPCRSCSPRSAAEDSDITTLSALREVARSSSAWWSMSARSRCKVTDEKLANRAVRDRPATARSWRATTRSTCSTLTCRAASRGANRAPMRAATARSRPTCPGVVSASPSATTCAFRRSTAHSARREPT